MAISGNSTRKRASNPLIPVMSCSASSQVTMASIAVCRLHRLGPRSARIRETSINDILCIDRLCFKGRETGEMGSHDELMRREGAYHRLYQAQARNVDTDLDDQRAETPQDTREST